MMFGHKSAYDVAKEFLAELRAIREALEYFVQAHKQDETKTAQKKRIN